MKKVPVVGVSVAEGPLYEVMGEDSVLVVYDVEVVAEAAGGARYVHKAFCAKGHARDEEGHAHPCRGARRDAEAFADKVRARGAIDPRYWELLPEEPSLAERWAEEAERERWERRHGEAP